MNEKQHIGLLFNRIAPRYDRFNHVTSLGIDCLWRRSAVRKMKPCEHALDVAVGTGDLAIEMIRQGKAEHVTGIDLSERMMEIGQQKVQKRGMQDRIDFVEGSALQLPFDDNTFDAVTCAYGIRNFSNLDQGLQEFYRVLKPGGQLVILEFSHPSNRFIAWCYDFYFMHIMTRIGRWMTHDAPAFRYFYSSVKDFIWGEEMLHHLRTAGFTQGSFRSQTFGISTHYTSLK